MCKSLWLIVDNSTQDKMTSTGELGLILYSYTP